MLRDDVFGHLHHQNRSEKFKVLPYHANSKMGFLDGDKVNNHQLHYKILSGNGNPYHPIDPN